jgi:hypothetical protein
VNEFKETKPEVPEAQDTSRLEQPDFNLDTVLSEMKEYAAESPPDSKEAVREYGLKECCDAAKNVFTRETLSGWGKMSAEQRGQKIQEYSKSLAEGLHIESKGIEFEKLNDNINGYVNKDGNIYLNKEFLSRPDKVIPLIETVAHEARRQMQFEAVKNPEKFDVDKAVINEWAAALGTKFDLSVDPYNFYNNPSESDARRFSEFVAREWAKEMTAGEPLNDNLMSTLDAAKPPSPGQASPTTLSFTGSKCSCSGSCTGSCSGSCKSSCVGSCTARWK